jgi:hypothetical protein
MTREEFIEVLDSKDYSYEMKGDRIVVTHEVNVYLGDLASIPPGAEFRNKGYVYLPSLTSLPPGVVFRNRGDVYLSSLSSLPSGVVFENRGDVDLNSLIGDWIIEWKGNIGGIDCRRLLNKMISLGLFDR